MNASGIKVRDLFDILQPMDAAQRADWFAANSLESTLLKRLQLMLASADSEHGVLDEVAAQHVNDLIASAPLHAPGPAWLGRRIGAYQISENIGQGGMATVFRAERQVGDFEQTVAVKVLHMGLFSDVARGYFNRERRLLAQLDHANISRLIDGGTTQGDVPYLIMEFVDGGPITDYCNTRQLGLVDRLRLLITTCRAVEASHRALIVHRDIKPSNVMVTRDGEVKLVDFGIAKLIDQQGTALTRSSLHAMTPDYAAPEQLLGTAVTTATDVYALGILIHELLLGCKPLRPLLKPPSSTVTSRSTGQSRLAVSTGASSSNRAPSGSQLSRFLRGDIDNILLKALDAEPSRRYGSAGALADDLERHLRGEPVLAHPPSSWYRVSKFVNRNRASVVVATALLMALIATTVYALHQSQRSQRAAAQANAALAERDQQLKRSNNMRDLMFDVFKEAEPIGRDEVPSVLDAVNAAVATLQRNRSVSAEDRAELQNFLTNVTIAQGKIDEGLALALRNIDEAGKSLGTDHEQVLSAHNLLGFAHLENQDYDQALAAFQVAIDGSQRAETKAEGMKFSAYIYGLKGDHDRALAMLEEALSICNKQCKNDVQRDVLAMQAAMQDASRDFPAAVATFERVIESERQQFGSDGLRLAEYLAVYSGSLLKIGRSDDAARAIRESLEITLKALPESDPRVGDKYSALSKVLRSTGDVEGAFTAGQKAIDIQEATSGPDSFVTLKKYADLAFTLGEMGDFERAFERYRTALTRAEKLKPAPGQLLAIVRQNYGGHLSKSGQSAAAKVELSRSINDFEAMQPALLQFEIIAEQKLVDLYLGQGDADAALKQLQQLDRKSAGNQKLIAQFAAESALQRARVAILQGNFGLASEQLEIARSSTSEILAADTNYGMTVAVCEAELALHDKRMADALAQLAIAQNLLAGSRSPPPGMASSIGRLAAITSLATADD